LDYEHDWLLELWQMFVSIQEFAMLDLDPTIELAW
jgi:hypothetical protein